MEGKQIESSEETAGVDNSTALYLTIAIIVALLVVIFGNTKHGYNPGFIARVFMFFLGSAGGFLGMKVGRAIRDAIIPDFVLTQGATGLIKARLFWAMGPQAIGLFVGMAAGMLIPILIAS